MPDCHAATSSVLPSGTRTLRAPGSKVTETDGILLTAEPAQARPPAGNLPSSCLLPMGEGTLEPKSAVDANFQVKARIEPGRSVVPAKAGTHAKHMQRRCFWAGRIPACAGMTPVSRARHLSPSG